MAKYNILEVLDFYQANGLDEVYDDKANNKYGNINQSNINHGAKTFSREKPAPIQIKLMNSTSQAIGELAKKNQILAQNHLVKNEIIEKNDNKFLSLNDIVANAKELARNAKSIDELKKIVENFDGCNLKKMATNTVFCDGNQNAKIMVIGEAPGNHEDLRGIPFCGDSGELLNAMFGSINLYRESDFYITNVIFWRPPGNRRPTEEEVAICRPFLERHIELFQPKLLILVGATAMSAIIKNDETISKIRGKFIDYPLDFLSHQCKILTIFHPSFLMRQPAKKKLAWQDMLKLKDFINNNYE